MNWLKKHWNYIKKILHFTKQGEDGTDSVNCQSSQSNTEQSLRFYDFNNIKLIDFEKCMNGQLEYMHFDKVVTPESYNKFLEVYYQYIDITGGGKEWAYNYREYVDVNVRILLLTFAKEMVNRGKYSGSATEKTMNENGYELPKGRELAMIDSYMATLEIQLDVVNKRLKKEQKGTDKNGIVSILTQINEIYKLYLPYNSILLCEFCEWYKKLNELSKKNKFKKNG